MTNTGTAPDGGCMDVLYFLKERTRFIRHFYETASDG